MLKHKTTMDFENWGKDRYLKLTKDNPIKFLLKSESEIFNNENGELMALNKKIQNFIEDESFVEHMRDAISLRIEKYYKERKF